MMFQQARSSAEGERRKKGLVILNAVYGEAGAVKKFFARLPKKFISKATGPNFDLAHETG